MELPKSVQEIAEVIGRERALYLIGQLPSCGRRAWRVSLYIPKRLPLDHPLIELIGWSDAEKLVKAFPGEILQPSTCRSIQMGYRNKSIKKLARMGMSVELLAESFTLSPRQIRNILKEEKTPEDFTSSPE